MRTTIKPLISITLTLLLTLPAPAMASGHYFACEQLEVRPNTMARLSLLEQQIALAKETAKNLISYLQQGQTDIQELRELMVENHKTIKSTANDCATHPQNRNCFFNQDIPLLHRKMRLYLAHSFAPQVSGSDLGQLSAAGNPYLLLPPGSPFHIRPEPLTKEEIALAQKELDIFWDGEVMGFDETEVLEVILGHAIKPTIVGVIDDYIEILREKSARTKNIPELYNQLQKNIQEFQNSRKLKTPHLRIQAALRIADPGWKAYLQSRLHMAHNLMLTELWKLTDRFRFLVYLPQANPSLANFDAALARSLLDNQNYTAKTYLAQNKVADFTSLDPIGPAGVARDQKVKAAESMIWLMDNHNFVEQTLSEHPEWCDAAENLRSQIDENRTNHATLVSLAVFSPMILLFPPAALALGVVGSTVLGTTSFIAFAHLTANGMARYEEVYERYMARWTPSTNQTALESELDVRKAQQNVMLSSFILGLSLGLPMMKAGALKNLWTGPSH